MLSEHARRAAADVWRIRERTEHEASLLFVRLAEDLAAADAPEPLVILAMRSADDEAVHAEHCRRIIDALVPGLAPLAPDLRVRLGHEHMSAADRALYASVAIGCITETLSTALLLEMRAGASAGPVREGLDVILRDEVRHSRLGWAYLAYASTRTDVTWLAGRVPAMLAAALDVDHDAPESELTDDDRRALAAWGILPRAEITRIVEATIRTTIAPGLARSGVTRSRAA